MFCFTCTAFLSFQKSTSTVYILTHSEYTFWVPDSIDCHFQNPDEKAWNELTQRVRLQFICKTKLNSFCCYIPLVQVLRLPNPVVKRVLCSAQGAGLSCKISKSNVEWSLQTLCRSYLFVINALLRGQGQRATYCSQKLSKRLFCAEKMCQFCCMLSECRLEFMVNHLPPPCSGMLVDWGSIFLFLTYFQPCI